MAALTLRQEGKERRQKEKEGQGEGKEGAGRSTVAPKTYSTFKSLERVSVTLSGIKGSL